ncbi:MAG TPA: SpoIIE family protein phosphatase [Bryobacteraceae bacterium]|nr:SpoIIE family protein phosphatase [Bryobacteraceae bacterium]
MRVPFLALLQRFGWLERLFVAVLAIAFAGTLWAPASAAWVLLATFAAFVLGVVVAIKWTVVGMRRVIWRLRYRLVVAYLFIAVVPILLIVALVGMGAFILTGQIATYLLTTELERMTSSLLWTARGLAWTPADSRPEHARWLGPAYLNRYPGLEMVIRDGTVWQYPQDARLMPPPAGWSDAGGLLRKNGALYVWGHAVHGSAEVTMVVPVTGELLRQLAPNLGGVSFRRAGALAAEEHLPEGGGARTNAPSREGFFDLDVPSATVVPVAAWESPGLFEKDVLLLVTRYSAVLRTLFGQNIEFRPGEATNSFVITLFFVAVTVLILVELVSIIIGVRLTRTITGSVHNLYQGTQRIRVGDFSHRIEVRGNDQLAELSQSFNHMTEDLERLVDVAKEKERLQSEIEIAREVQNQLFPKSLPVSKTLELAAACLPARLVSGDYYDYMNLEAPSLALAIGDVAGKGISAALLMATVQSIMRTQLRAGRELAFAAGNGSHQAPFSTAALVSRLNQQLFAYTPAEKFATFYFGLYDDSTGILTYTNAGHLPPILIREGKISRLDVTGTVVGAFSFAEYGETSIRLLAGDLLVCFTDGVTEPENEFGEMFSEERLAEVVLKHADCESDKIMSAVMDSVQHWTGSPELQDDLTLLLARRI